MATLPQTKRPQIRRVQIKIQEYLGSKYERGEGLTYYDTTAAKVTALIRAALGKK